MEYQDRNPSPPPDARTALSGETSTSIGNTIFSKCWLFQCLLDAIKQVESECLSEDGAEEMGNISEDLEQQLCTLWDMSANQEVSAFLEEFHASEMFVQLMGSTKAPRLLEILLGILANMCTFEETCLQVSKTDSLIRVCLWLLGSTDAPALLQLSRLLRTCLAHPSTGPLWIEQIRENLAPTVDHLQTILLNSLNGDLVSSTLKLVDRLCDAHPEVSAALANVDFVRALSSAAMQMLTECAVLEDYWHILYNLECETQFAPLLEPCVEDLGGLLKAFLSCLQDSAAGTDENIEEDSETRRFQLLCLPFCFLANLSDKGRHLLFDDSAVSDSSFSILHELENSPPPEQIRRSPQNIEYRTMLKDSLRVLTRGVTR
ncbi:protein saal1-like [Varroa jacobsoni]|uniref:Protein SAAL1 n=1 Tax=Varroa destructor TaxID=109461 RepID=A0A7M7KQG4_VARDE|nr:protein saal1-like [Varroa destructor]XP_022670432.1 protein saal1-like [Varroa destructor]XP_022695805.1 protein saal1-like [Varroa jacobsoni]XP_022695806.1 protein saal1-like [Varroa jacobsoni]XP_022695807.1 protein saal1-like [Varroa jacobsoni]XP_022695808.1 protein saal1-like [Varroa jacobsoni]